MEVEVEVEEEGWDWGLPRSAAESAGPGDAGDAGQARSGSGGSGVPRWPCPSPISSKYDGSNPPNVAKAAISADACTCFELGLCSAAAALEFELLPRVGVAGGLWPLEWAWRLL